MRHLSLSTVLMAGCMPIAAAAPPSRVGSGAGATMARRQTPTHEVYRLDAGASLASTRGKPPPLDATAGYLLQHDAAAERSSHGLFAEIGPRVYADNDVTSWATLRGVLFPDWDGTQTAGYGGFLRLSIEKSMDVHGAGADADRGFAGAVAGSGKLAVGGFVESGVQRTASEDAHSFVTSLGLAVRIPAFAGVAIVAPERLR